MRTGIQALAVLLFFLATLTIFSGRTRGTGFLAARVAALEAELNRQPVVIDANGEEVGSVVVPFGTAAGGHTWLHHRCWPEWYAQSRNRGAENWPVLGVVCEGGNFPNDFDKIPE